jgi:hypothetical protein
VRSGISPKQIGFGSRLDPIKADRTQMENSKWTSRKS